MRASTSGDAASSGDAACCLAGLRANEDLADRGIEAKELVPGLKSIACGDVAKLFDDFDLVLHG